MYIYQRKTLINTTPKELFNFHMDFKNVKVITPKDIKVEILEKPDNLKEGEIIKVKSTKMFISQLWEVKVTKIIENKEIIDVAIKSPFSFWKHRHIFKKTIEGTELIDEIEFELPFGLLNKIGEPIFAKLILEDMFSKRQYLTKKYFENK